jgi:hypothetical protein
VWCVVCGVWEENVDTFYHNLKQFYLQHKCTSDHIWNSDETRVQLVGLVKAESLHTMMQRMSTTSLLMSRSG